MIGFMGENKETLDMVSKLSQIENPRDKIQGKLAADVFCPESVKLASKFGVGRSVGGSMVRDAIGGKNLMDNESLSDYPEDKLSVVMRGNDVNDNAVVLEGKLESCGKVDVCIDMVGEPFNKCGDMLRSPKLEKVDESNDKGNHVLHPHKPGSLTKLEVSGNRINLFVDVFGHTNGNVDGKREVGHKLGESESNEKYSLERERTFKSGDLVWVKTRNQSWLPGMVSQPKREKGFSFLVKYYGDPNFVLCDSSDLKPFIKYFEEMSEQNKSKNFCSSVEKALCELDKRIKSEMTCACFTKEKQAHDAQLSAGNSEQNSMSADKDSKLGVLSHLEPASFYANIKNLACSVSAPGQIELMVLKNCLSLFYYSLGHLQLPPEKLIVDKNQNNPDGGDLTRARRKKRSHSGLVLGDETASSGSHSGVVLGDETASSAKGVESRQRKKSKYLSYPYVDVVRELSTSSAVKKEKEDPKSPSSLNANITPLANSSGKKRAKKPLKCHTISKAANIDASSSELLAGLLSTARDCSSLEGSKYSESLKRFYSGYRAFAFLDVDIASKVSGKKQNSTKALKIEGGEVVKKSKGKTVNLASVKESAENVEGGQSKEGVEVVKTPNNKSALVKENFGSSQLTNTDNSHVKQSVMKKARKKKEGVEVVKTPNNNSALVKENVGSSQLTNTDNSHVKQSVMKKARKKKEGVEVVKTPNNKSAFVKENVGSSQLTNTDNSHVKQSVMKKARKKKEQVANTQNPLEGIGVVKQAENQKLNNSSTEGTVENAAGDKFLKTDNPRENVTNSKAVGPNIFHNSSGMINFQNARSNVPISGTTPAKGEGVIPVVVGIADLDRNRPSFSSQHVPVGEPSSKPLTAQKIFKPISPGASGGIPMVYTPLSSSKEASVTPQNTPQGSSSVNVPNQSQNEDVTATESGPHATNTGVSRFAHYTLKMGIFGSPGTSEPRKRKRKRKEKPARSAAPAIPDLNGNVLDMNLSGSSMPEGSQVSPESEPPKKRVNKSDAGPDGEPLCGNVLLNFAPGSTLPSVETLVATFSRFGLLKESELQVLGDSSVQVVYERRADARFAYRSLVIGHSFGESLVSFTTDCMPPPSSVKKKQNVSNVQTLPTSPPIGASKNQATPSAAVDASKNQATPSAPVDASKNQNKQRLPTSPPIGASKNQATPSAAVDASKNQATPSAPVDASKNQNNQRLPTSPPIGASKNQATPSAPVDASKNQNKQRLPTSTPIGASKYQASPSGPVDASKNQATPSAPVVASKNQNKPNVALIKQNVEMMKMTLEKAGNSLAPELKAKLENEIKMFLNKINSMEGSSSSSS